VASLRSATTLFDKPGLYTTEVAPASSFLPHCLVWRRWPPAA